MECSVCYEQTTNTTSCNHYTCIQCLTKIVRKEKNTCPICREPFDPKPFQYIPPKHTPNLSLAKRKISMFNRFLKQRYFLEKCKRQLIYRDLMMRYTKMYYISNTYICKNDNFYCYDKYLLLEIYLYLKGNFCIYKYTDKNYLASHIEAVLCS